MIRPSSNALLCCALWSAVGCGKLASDYTVTLVPHTLTGQEPFKDGREVELILIEPSGDTQVYYGGAIQGGQVTIEELPPIAAGTTIGVLIEEPGGASSQIDLDLAAAWGSAVIPSKLDTGETAITVDVLIAEIATVGDLGALPDNRKSIGAGVAMVPGGDVYLFGGSAGGTAPPSERILWMTDTDLGTWDFDKIDETLQVKDTVNAWYGVTASTLVEEDGSVLIFVSGGRAEPGALPGSPARAGYLFDPVSQKWAFGHKDNQAFPTIARSEAGHVVMDNNRVVIYGGWGSSLTSSFIEVFNPKTRSYELSDNVAHGVAYPAGASMGPAGALVCGGGDLNAALSITEPVASCDTITLGGAVSSSTEMPTALMGHAMARLADGTILVTGGVTDVVDDLSAAPATNEGWIYNGSAWAPTPGTMKFPRAHHRIIPMPDGNAIILGGAEEGGAVFHNGSPAVICPELYNAGSKTFSEIQPCSAAGAGVNPGVSQIDSEGAFILAGEDTSAGSPNGDAYGFIAFPPDLD